MPSQHKLFAGTGHGYQTNSVCLQLLLWNLIIYKNSVAFDCDARCAPDDAAQNMVEDNLDLDIIFTSLIPFVNNLVCL